jgi:hypothetical protein
MPPIIRNTLIRLSALIEQIWRGLLRTLSRLGNVFGKLAGLSELGYYLEENGQSEQAAQSVSSAELPQAPPATTLSRRRAGREVDAFRKMAQQIKQDQQN